MKKLTHSKLKRLPSFLIWQPNSLIVLLYVALLVEGPFVLASDTFEQLWKDLEKGEPEATHAILSFAADPEKSVPFIGERLKPLALDKEQANALVADLGSSDADTWQQAFEELEYFDPRLAIDLETLMADVSESPARERLVEVLTGRGIGYFLGKSIELREVDGGSNFNFRVGTSAFWAEHKVSRLRNRKWIRAARTIVLLQHIGTPESVRIIQEMATGHPDALPTEVAREAMQSLNQDAVEDQTRTTTAEQAEAPKP